MILLTMIAVLVQGNPSFRVVERGIQSVVDERREAVARTAEEWAALYKGHQPDRAAPNVDFSREIVVAVFLGSRPTAGFGVEIVEVVTGTDGAITVRYRERRPAGDAITAQVITSPYVIASLPRPGAAAAPVRFERVPN